ncbi:MAG: 2,3,4,5-tetrahydropyridine-2,6-dicarboxylate N-succinyltransferase [Frankiales bacterium]|nr:MAG: 2,3,4,5-tetrahydropyridine-2,6-dicarboxylate N-succinyltransferase [Frankiales bacterium]
MTGDRTPERVTRLAGMTQSPLDPVLDELWERRADLSPADEDARKVVVAAVDQLDAGEARVAQVVGDEVVVDERAKRAILLSFKVLEMVEGSSGGFYVHDRVPLKTSFPGVRVVAGAIARWGSHFEPGVVLMPSYTNIGGYVGSGSMVDTWATVGSCAQIGRNVHLSGGVGIGGVLEPPQAAPVVVEDDAFIGSRSMVVEGARVRRGAKLGAGAILTASTRVFDAETGEELPRGEAPERAVCVGSTRVKSFAGGEFGMPCLLVLRRLEPGQEHDKLALNDILREHGVAP